MDINPEQPVIVYPCWLHEWGVFGFVYHRSDTVNPVYILRDFTPSGKLPPECFHLISCQGMRIEGLSPTKYTELSVREGYLRIRVLFGDGKATRIQVMFQPMEGDPLMLFNIPQLTALLDGVRV